MYRLGSQRNHLYALLFGGAQIIDAFAGVNDVGADNIAVAERTLYETGIAAVYRDVGGTRARKLFFRTDTGGYAVKLLPLGAE
jgi:chemotaxis receptor (MCP) glutamine deamidase CheD